MNSPLRMQDKNILDHYSDLSVGDVFARARQAAGLTLQEAASQTMISYDVLDSIESCKAKRLPSRVYTIGFIRNYAEFLRLDADKMVYLFEVQVIGQDDKETKSSSKRKNDLKDSFLSRLPVFAVVAMMSGVVLILGSFSFIAYRYVTYAPENEIPIFNASEPSLDDYMIPLPNASEDMTPKKD